MPRKKKPHWEVELEGGSGLIFTCKTEEEAKQFQRELAKDHPTYRVGRRGPCSEENSDKLPCVFVQFKDGRYVEEA